MSEPTTQPPIGPPVFGVRTAPIEQTRYKRFGLEVEHGADRFVSYFEVYPDLDGGALFTLMNATTEAGQANAVAMLLGAQLRDDDGVPYGWEPGPPLVRDDYEPTTATEDDDPYERADDGAHLFERWDGEAVTFDGLGFDEVEDGSSRRRFGFLMDSTRHRIKYEALSELAQWLVAEATARPTRRSTPSRRGPGATPRGRSAKQP